MNGRLAPWPPNGVVGLARTNTDNCEGRRGEAARQHRPTSDNWKFFWRDSICGCWVKGIFV